jgi:DNA (cytosine-5)-methyltransferase 1
LRRKKKKNHPKKPAFCITATTGSKGAANPYHWDSRAFTVNEVKRIMSIPDDYVLTGTYQQKVERLGRMVAPFMMKAVAEQILRLGVINENTK